MAARLAVRAAARVALRVAGGAPAGSVRKRTAGSGEGRAGESGALRLLAATRHSRKLRRGTHVANRFAITLREVVPHGAAETFEASLKVRLAQLAERGFPNYIGPQRFGRDARNVVRALAWFRQPKRRTSRLQRGLWLSAARSALFNRVCAARVAAGTWCELLPGEPVALAGSRSFFVPDDGAPAADGERTLAARLASGDVHPSAPWWGRGEAVSRGDCRTFEAAVLADDGALRDGLERAGLNQERRALRVLPRSLAGTWHPDAVPHEAPGGRLELVFELPPGAFATTLLAELGDCRRAEGVTDRAEDH